MKVILYDSSPNGAVGWSWAIGSFRPGWTRIGAKSWDEAAEAIGSAIFEATSKLNGIAKLATLQIWGHGQPGEPLLAGKPMTPAFMRRVQVGVSPTSLVWFRMCSVFFGAKGQAFAERTANELNCRTAGHSHVIGPWQSGLYSLKPGQTPSWAVGNGVWRSVKSGWRKQRTVFCTNMSFPDGW